MSDSDRHSDHSTARRQQAAITGRTRLLRAGSAIVLCGWAIAVIGGFAVLIAYEYEPGPLAHPPLTWPENPYVDRDGQRMTLLVFVHPQCPCTAATLSEIGTLLGDVREPPRIITCVLAPVDQPAGWVRTRLWDTARRLAGVVPVADRDGVVARCFGVRASGHVLLYDRTGRLRYSGGVTASRGHAGDNYGRSRLEAVLNRTEARGKAPGTVEEFPVFGCLLFADSPPDSP